MVKKQMAAGKFSSRFGEQCSLVCGVTVTSTKSAVFRETHQTECSSLGLLLMFSCTAYPMTTNAPVWFEHVNSLNLIFPLLIPSCFSLCFPFFLSVKNYLLLILALQSFYLIFISATLFQNLLLKGKGLPPSPQK